MDQMFKPKKHKNNYKSQVEFYDTFESNEKPKIYNSFVGKLNQKSVRMKKRQSQIPTMTSLEKE